MLIDVDLIVKWIVSITTICSFIFVIYKFVISILNRIKTLEKNSNTLHEDVKSSKEERQILIEAQLACLKGLKEQGCNGPVTQAINRIEKFMIEKSHD